MQTVYGIERIEFYNPIDEVEQEVEQTIGTEKVEFKFEILSIPTPEQLQQLFNKKTWLKQNK